MKRQRSLGLRGVREESRGEGRQRRVGCSALAAEGCQWGQLRGARQLAPSLTLAVGGGDDCSGIGCCCGGGSNVFAMGIVIVNAVTIVANVGPAVANVGATAITLSLGLSPRLIPSRRSRRRRHPRCRHRGLLFLCKSLQATRRTARAAALGAAARAAGSPDAGHRSREARPAAGGPDAAGAGAAVYTRAGAGAGAGRQGTGASAGARRLA
jgi:hypothetical protein